MNGFEMDCLVVLCEKVEEVLGVVGDELLGFEFDF